MQTPARAIVLAALTVALSTMSGCWGDDNETQYSQLKCDASGCLICEKSTCYQYACSALYECPAGYSCSANSECRLNAAGSVATGPIDTTGAQCTGTMQCPTGTICSYGECVDAEGMVRTTECTLSNQCGADRVCIDGVCVAHGPEASEEPPARSSVPCAVNADCPAGDMCQNGGCTSKSFPLRPEGTCQFNGDCGTSGTCINTRCYFPPVDGACPEGASNSYGLCLPVVEPANECKFSTECGSGSLCVNATCVRTCDADIDCNWGNHCGDYNTCVLDDRPILQCLDNSDCADSCVDGRCLSLCGVAMPCDSDSQCTYGFCMANASCFEMADCATGFECIDGRCDTLGDDAAASAEQDASQDAAAAPQEP